MREQLEFERSFKNSKNEKKSVMIVTVDGGLVENPRYGLTISCMVDYFNTCDFDAFFLVTNATGRSVLNRVERRMAALLEHNYFGAHLDDKGHTIDHQLELKNFELARKTLGEILSGMVINGYPVIAEYIGNKASEIVKDVSEKWKSCHVRPSQCLLQSLNATILLVVCRLGHHTKML